ncbi:MAG: phosphopentomutase [Anaerolineae bacterium]|nr:phosphopentomutase [Gemmatimonadaceae bacterium]
MSRRAVIIVLDGVGIGEAPDAESYGDSGSDTLGNIAAAVGGLDLPNLEAAGLGCIRPLPGIRRIADPIGAWGSLLPRSAGKDSTAGHWEIAGIQLAAPFPTYPNGFPDDVIAEFVRRTGRPVIGNVVGSGTDVIGRYGAEHVRSGAWIVYTSADSVFQVAAHEHVVAIDELYDACRIARQMLVPPHALSRVIARPFEGSDGAYSRTVRRKDFSVPPPGETLLDALEARGVPRRGVGKVDDLFASRAIDSEHVTSNAHGILAIHRALSEMDGGLLFANLVDFDQLWGHRNDVTGFYEELRYFDAAMPALRSALSEDDLLFLTADHGNDPTTPSTDHSRERVPLLAIGARVRPVSIGERPTFSDLGATVSEWLGSEFRGCGTSFLQEILSA